MQLVILASAEIVVTIVAASIPILRALARDRGTRTGQRFNTLNATLIWTRRRTSRTRDASVDMSNETIYITSDAQDDNKNGQNQETPRQDWYNSGRRLKPLSRITETDEMVSETDTVKSESSPSS